MRPTLGQQPRIGQPTRAQQHQRRRGEPRHQRKPTLASSQLLVRLLIHHATNRPTAAKENENPWEKHMATGLASSEWIAVKERGFGQITKNFRGGTTVQRDGRRGDVGVAGRRRRVRENPRFYGYLYSTSWHSDARGSSGRAYTWSCVWWVLKSVNWARYRAISCEFQNFSS